MRERGYQSILMAPTEILARQHYETAVKLFPGGRSRLSDRCTDSEEKNDLCGRILDGSVKIVIGTHALLYGDISFQNLGLIITDEQHRFGVKQRAALSGGRARRTYADHVGDPIPRTLACIVWAYGYFNRRRVSTGPQGDQDLSDPRPQI